MKTILRNGLAVLLGILVGGVVNMTLVAAGSVVIPPPAGVNPNDAASLSAGMHLLEPRHFLFPFLAHAGGTFAGALLANVVAATRRQTLSLVIGAFYLLGGIAACFMIPAPAWFIAVDLALAYFPMAWLASRVGGRLRPEKAHGSL